MNVHETIVFIHVYMSTHEQIHRRMYNYISTNILTRLPILTCQADGEIAFFVAGLHYHHLVQRCLLGRPTECYVPQPHKVIPDDIDSAYGQDAVSLLVNYWCFAEAVWRHGYSKSRFCLTDGGQNSSVGKVLGWLSCVMQQHGFDPPLRRIFQVEGIFFLELTWVLTPWWENKPRSSLCIPSHGLKWSWHSCPRQVNGGNKNTSTMHHPQKQNVTSSMVG